MDSLLTAQLSLGISLLAILVAFYTYRKNYQISLRPILIFFNESGSNCWSIQNAGNGPAINISIYSGNNPNQSDNQDSVLYSAISKDSSISIVEFPRPSALVCTYSDTLGREYTTVCENSRNSITLGNSFPNLKPSRFQWQSPRNS